MASATFWSEEDFSCSICLDVFNSPVFTPCGHNFCRTCIATCWDVRGQCRCPFCNELFHTRPDLRVNTLISEMVDRFRSSLRGKTQPCVEPDLRIPEGSSTHQGLSNGGGPSSVIRRDLVESPGTAEGRNTETKRLAELRSAPNECKCPTQDSFRETPSVQGNVCIVVSEYKGNTGEWEGPSRRLKDWRERPSYGLMPRTPPTRAASGEISPISCCISGKNAPFWSGPPTRDSESGRLYDSTTKMAAAVKRYIFFVRVGHFNVDF